MYFYNEEVKLGEKKDIEIKLPDGDSLKLTVIRGARPGKSLVITAGVHGCEYVGIQAAVELCKELNPADLSGQVILLPIANEEGFYGSRQEVISDRKNLNGVFPGSLDGTKAEQIAKLVEDHLYPAADFLVDLHSGGIREGLIPFLFFPAYASEDVTKKARQAAKSISLPYRVASSAKNGLYSWAAQSGVPALLLERGCKGLWTREEVDAYKENIYELLRHLQIITGDSKELDQIEINRASYLEASEDGFWYPFIEEGDLLLKGSLLGELRDAEGSLLKSYHAEFDGIVLYYTLSLGVKKNSNLVAYGQLNIEK